MERANKVPTRQEECLRRYPGVERWRMEWSKTAMGMVVDVVAVGRWVLGEMVE